MKRFDNTAELQRMADRIVQIADQNVLREIKAIIERHNPSKMFTKYASGYSIRFNGLAYDTYTEINALMQAYDAEQRDDTDRHCRDMLASDEMSIELGSSEDAMMSMKGLSAAEAQMMRRTIHDDIANGEMTMEHKLSASRRRSKK